MQYSPRLTTYRGAKAWDVIWKWNAFTKDAWRGEFRQWKEGTRRALGELLSELSAKSVLDCTCGPGWKTIILSELGYDAEGSDGSAVAVKLAQELAQDEGLDIRFFRSRWEKLVENCGRKYDCVFNDAYAWTTTRQSLNASACGIYSVLKRGGVFVFQGAHQWSRDEDRERLIQRDFDFEGQFEALPVHEKDGVKLVTMITREKRPDGVMGNRIHIIDDHGRVRIEVASILDQFKWTWTDYTETLKAAGFSRVYSVKKKGTLPFPYYLNVAVK